MSTLGDMVGVGDLFLSRRNQRVPAASASRSLEGCDESASMTSELARRRQEAQIRRTIESEIVPRLLLTHVGEGRSWGGSPRRLGMDDVVELARMVVAHDAGTARSFVDAMRSEGVAVDEIRLDLLAPAARLLGELWASDRCTFAEVSIGLSRLQRVARGLGLEEIELVSGLRKGRVVLAPVPGEQHTLGVSLVADMLRERGWDVSHLPKTSEEELLQVVQHGFVEMVGLSVSNGRLLGGTTRLIKELRRHGENRQMLITVGGACFGNRDERDSLGADATALDAREIVQYMQRHFERVVMTRARP